MERMKTLVALDDLAQEERWARVEHLVDTGVYNYYQARLAVGIPEEQDSYAPVVAQRAEAPARPARRVVGHRRSGNGPQHGEESAVGYEPNATGDVVFPRLAAEQVARNSGAIAVIKATVLNAENGKRPASHSEQPTGPSEQQLLNQSRAAEIRAALTSGS
ncbi:MAG TPA: hypothetical protein VMR45_05915 [Patescibacteria group bacterium]|nr:hypothetical protein [Patescibacteria group bacterium]